MMCTSVGKMEATIYDTLRIGLNQEFWSEKNSSGNLVLPGSFD